MGNFEATSGQIYRSECGQYLCRSTRFAGHFEAWLLDGSVHWRDDNRVQTWADQKKYCCPLAQSVGGYSAQQLGQKIGSFTLKLLHCDITKQIEPFQGNTVLEQLDVVFRRKVPAQNVPRWIRQADAIVALRHCATAPRLLKAVAGV
jgi:hypothetical protein